MEQRLSLITLGVSDLARSRAFYERAFGWSASEQSNDDIVFFPLNGMVFSLYPLAKFVEETGFDASPAPGPIMIAHNARSEAEVDAIVEQATARGAKLVKAPVKVFWGGYSGYLGDPDGHLIEIAYNPFWTIDAQGHISF